jgi:hypothetical protein
MKRLQQWVGVASVVLMLMVVINSQPGQAQDSTSASKNYRLIQPTIDDYLAVVDAVVADADMLYEIASWSDTNGLAELDVLTDEVLWRFLDDKLSTLDADKTITYQQLLTLYHALAASPYEFPVESDSRLIPYLIERWLAENPTRLNPGRVFVIDTFAFDVYQLEENTFSLRLIPIVLDGSTYYGSTYYDQPFRRGEVNYIVIQQALNYRVPALPIPMFGHARAAGDFNMDGQMDFAYYSYDGVNNYETTKLVIVTWDGTRLTTLVELDFFYELDTDPRLTWDFGQFDEDGQQELVQTYHLADDWGCNSIQITYYDWDDSTPPKPISEVSQKSFPLSFSCLLSQAEGHMRENRLEDAIASYQQALAQPVQRDYLIPYVQMRLGLAYLMTGQAEQARTAIAAMSIPQLAYTEGASHHFSWVDPVRDTILRDLRLLPACQVIYNHTLEIYYFNRIMSIMYATSNGFYKSKPYYEAFLYERESLSCHLSALMQTQLAKVTFSTDTAPTSQLEVMGLKVVDSINADLDTDGDEDWLVWVSPFGMDPLLFVSEDEQYAMTILNREGYGDYLNRTADLRPPDAFNIYRIIRLPDNTLALANLDLGSDVYGGAFCEGYYCIDGPENFCPSDHLVSGVGMGDLTLWHIQGERLTQRFFAYICDWYELDDMIPEASGQVVDRFVAGKSYKVGEWRSEVRPVEYVWDSDTGSFLPPLEPTPTILPTRTPTPVPAPEMRYFLDFHTLNYVRQAFASRDYTSTLEILNSALSTADTAEQASKITLALRYYRALTFEALNRPDEALADYTAVYITSPLSVWGRLAALHLAEI